jgi:hypothetical protein
MGNVWYAYVSHPDTAPDIKNPPTFDPLFGFENGRRERSKYIFISVHTQVTVLSCSSIGLGLESRLDRHDELLLCKRIRYVFEGLKILNVLLLAFKFQVKFAFKKI